MNNASDIEELAQPVGDQSWCVAHAKPRCEKKIADFCSRYDFDCYLPQVKREHRYGNRKRINTIPLFPGYVFVLVDESGRSKLKASDYIANLLQTHDQDVLLQQLNQVKKALDHAGPVQLLPKFSQGMVVEVQSGPLQGVEGIVERVKNSTRIILNVDFIKQSLAVEVDAKWLVPR